MIETCPNIAYNSVCLSQCSSSFVLFVQRCVFLEYRIYYVLNTCRKMLRFWLPYRPYRRLLWSQRFHVMQNSNLVITPNAENFVCCLFRRIQKFLQIVLKDYTKSLYTPTSSCRSNYCQQHHFSVISINRFTIHIVILRLSLCNSVNFKCYGTYNKQ
jgi:hypothetical protein